MPSVFFFQAEDGIRDRNVTGVQTCALPILRRQALSYAIDRKAICDSLFFGTRSPATDFAVPVIDGGGATDIPGSEVLEFDEAKAKELWEKAEEMEPFKGP